MQCRGHTSSIATIFRFVAIVKLVPSCITACSQMRRVRTSIDTPCLCAHLRRKATTVAGAHFTIRSRFPLSHWVSLAVAGFFLDTHTDKVMGPYRGSLPRAIHGSTEFRAACRSLSLGRMPASLSLVRVVCGPFVPCSLDALVSTSRSSNGWSSRWSVSPAALLG